MAKKGYKDTGQDFVVGGVAASVLAASVTGLVTGDSILPDPVLMGGCFASGAIIVDRFSPFKMFNFRRGAADMRHNERLHIQQEIDDDYTRRVILKWRDRVKPLPDEFIFSGLGLPVPVREDVFYSFLQAAHRRQNQAFYGNGLRPMKINWVLSEDYFTRQHSPRFISSQYTGCLIILGYARLLEGRQQGSSGWIGGGHTPDRALELCKYKWAKLLAPTDRRPAFMALIPKFSH